MEAGGREEEEEEMSEEASLSSVVDFKAKGSRERNNFFKIWFTTRRPEKDIGNGKRVQGVLIRLLDGGEIGCMSDKVIID